MPHTNNGEPSYALVTGKADRLRLSILNELYNFSSLSQLNVAPGMKVLTIGCGIALLELEIAEKVTDSGLVLATDVSVEQLEVAKQNAKEANVHNIQFLEIDAADISQISGQFDRIHCRAVLTHQPLEKAKQIIPILLSKLAPGGFLLLEELLTLDSLTCSPHSNPGYDKWVACCHKQTQIQNSDPNFGRNLMDFLEQEGIIFSCSLYQPIL